MTKLFSPLKLGTKYTSNRIFMAPLTRGRGNIGGLPNPRLMGKYYSQRSSAGLIISEATAVSEQGLGWLNTCGIYNDGQRILWSNIVNDCRRGGCLFFMQLWHMGACVHPDFYHGRQPVSASAITLNGALRTPQSAKEAFVQARAMSLSEISQVQDDFVESAKRAIEAGCDGIEIHAANGFLIDQFIRSGTNKRSDNYGQSIENRLRFCLEVVEKCCEAIGSDRVGIRISPTNKVWGIFDDTPEETFFTLIEKLNQFGLAYLHLLEPLPGRGHPIETFANFAPEIRNIFNGNLILNGGYDKTTAINAIETGLADAISFGTPFISNPDLVNRFALNQPLSPSDPDTYYSNGAEGYIDYLPMTFKREETVHV